MENNFSNKFKYDAFISYRRDDIDLELANILHKELESFKLPKNVIKKMKEADPNASTSITRVFKDSAELPSSESLEDQIVDALRQSRFLIVICSPRLKESKWCQKEIETFAAMYGRDRILTLLIDGRSTESIPEFLRTRQKEIRDVDGNTVIINESVEPLAADIRGKNLKENKKKLKSEILRLVALCFL